jgi:hypothetical protein
MAIGVYYLGLVICCCTYILQVVQVNMAMYKVSGFKYPHKPEKGLKTAVAGIFLVMDTQRRSMGEEYIQKAAIPQFIEKQAGNEAPYFIIHLTISELIGTIVITQRSPQSHDNEVPFLIDFRTHMNCPGTEGIPFFLERTYAESVLKGRPVKGQFL